MQETLYQTADEGDSLSDSGCMRHSIRQRMQVTLYLKDDAKDKFIRQRMQETLYQTEETGDTLSDSGGRSISIRQWMQESLY